jgi:primosomal protein N' (replication factor Y)
MRNERVAASGSEGERPGRRLVEVAVDAAGGGGNRTYTYHVPERLADLEAGEAVLVEYGRRQAMGIVLSEAVGTPGVPTKPVLERVRSDGALLPPLALGLARWISATYLAPSALVLRAMLPPGLLERLELIAERLPDPAGRSGDVDPVDSQLLAQLEAGRRAVRDLHAPEGRAALVRRLRSLGGRGFLTLEWTLAAAGAGPRYERWATASSAGTALVAGSDPSATGGGRALGPRQVDALRELAEAGASGVLAARISERHGPSALPGLVRRGLVDVEVRQVGRRPLAERAPGARGARPIGTPLGAEQAAAIDVVRRAIADRDPTPLLVDGVTGAGKTAVYVEAIMASLDADRPVLVLVPEISHALPLVDRLRADLAASVAIIHSGLGAGERADEWRRIRSGGVEIVVGTRLAVLAPLRDLGLVVVDEEHESAYKSDRTPRFQARDSALALARMAGAAVILGSATPSVETYGRALEGEYRRTELPTRAAGRPPRIDVVDLRDELASGNRGTLSRMLATALASMEGRPGERAILVINRRGTASVVLCRDCGHVQACPDCDRPLVFHRAAAALRCHHCGMSVPPALRCPACRSPRIRYLGGGTERVEREVRDRFPSLRVGRLDRDVAEQRGAAERVLDAFADGRLDVLVGTSLVAKGLDIPQVTLVGIVSADVALNLPDERAAERTYQLLVQAAGRAGRGDLAGRVVLQTYQPDHPVIRAVVSGDRDAFYDAELAARRRFRSPPFGRLVKLTVSRPEAADAEREAHALAERLRARAAERASDVTVVGPAPAYVARRAGRWRWNVLLRGADPAGLLDGGLDAPWSVDVDPESTL